MTTQPPRWRNPGYGVCYAQRAGDLWTKPARANIFLTLLFAGTLLVIAPGCEIFGIFAYALFPPKILARHQLADQKTLVLIDDPSNHLVHPALAIGIANDVGYWLTKEHVLSASHIVPSHHILDLADRLGDQFNRTAVDRIGIALGAQQVIHVHIKSISLQQEPGVFHPTAMVQVKVIDTKQGKRLFPPPYDLTKAQASDLTVTMRYRTQDPDGHDPVRQARKALAHQLGQEVARLFFDYLPRQPGEPFE